VYLANERSLVYVDDLGMRWVTAVWPAPPSSGVRTIMKNKNSALGQSCDNPPPTITAKRLGIRRYDPPT
jgi:hypothetical protein